VLDIEPDDEEALDKACIEGGYVDGKGNADQEAFFEWIFGDDQPFAGQKLYVEAIATKTKQEKKDFTKLVYTHAEEDATTLKAA
jgi:hypothetical protein